MGNNNKNNLSEEFLRKIRYRNDYIISETPKYRPLVDDNEVFDEIPNTNEAGGQEEDSPERLEREQPREPSNMQSVETEPPTPEFDDNETGLEELPPQEVDNMGSSIEPSMQVDTIQNDIIKHNTLAMKGIYKQLENLSNTVVELNKKIDVLDDDVEEVREPTNVEKLMSKNDVSYPYYFNLNDFWKGNWFNENRENSGEKGIRELPDGTFIADFDDLPEKSSNDIKDSFNDY